MKIFSAVAALTLAVSLSACQSGDSEPAATPTVTVTAEPEGTPAEETSPEIQDNVFLEVVRDEYPELSYLPDAQLIELATVSCEAFDAGASGEDVITNILASSNDPAVQESMAFVIGAGVGVYCPEHTDVIEDAITSAS